MHIRDEWSWKGKLTLHCLLGTLNTAMRSFTSFFNLSRTSLLEKEPLLDQNIQKVSQSFSDRRTAKAFDYETAAATLFNTYGLNGMGSMPNQRFISLPAKEDVGSYPSTRG